MRSMLGSNPILSPLLYSGLNYIVHSSLHVSTARSSDMTWIGEKLEISLAVFILMSA
jgi:hypothetical protein